MPSEKLKEWCRAELPPELYARAGEELTKFRNYFLAKTGQGATKLDWDRTFQNWMLGARDRYGASRPASGAPAQYKTAAEKNAEAAKRRQEQAERAEKLMADGMEARQAWEAAGEEIRHNGIDTCTAPGYIEGEVIADTPREVTAT